VRKPYAPERVSETRLAGHLGVDFSVCETSVVIAIADGTVGYSDIGQSGDDASYEYSGGTIHIFHAVPGHPEQATLYAYAHLEDIRVGSREHVRRGQVIARPWVPKEGGGWIPHVHLEILGKHMPAEDFDPLRTVKGCISTAKPNEYVYPVQC
jgi:murein DD-endopeptidase MepM/ murein hydrolase activator NlpD